MAVAVSCWIGEIGRFANAKKLVSYFGIAPKVDRALRGKGMGTPAKREAAGWRVFVSGVCPLYCLSRKDLEGVCNAPPIKFP